MVSVTKDGVKFSTTGDIGSANITCRQNMSMDKARTRRQPRALRRAALTRSRVPQAEEQTVIDLNEPVTLTFALRYLNSFTKARGRAGHAPLAARVLTRAMPFLPPRTGDESVGAGDAVDVQVAARRGGVPDSGDGLRALLPGAQD